MHALMYMLIVHEYRDEQLRISRVQDRKAGYMEACGTSILPSSSLEQT